MPRVYQMSWEGEPHFRWVKMFKGIRYRVTCSELKLAKENWTKELSYRDANQWWEKKKSKIVDNHPYADERKEQLERIDYAKRHGLDDELPSLTERLHQIDTADPATEVGLPKELHAKIKALQGMGADLSKIDTPTLLAAFGYDDVHLDRLAREKTVDPERRISALIVRWLDVLKEEVANGKRKASTYQMIVRTIEVFKRQMGRAEIDSINPELIQRWYSYCSAQLNKRNADPAKKEGWSVDYAARLFSIAKTFIRWLYDMEYIATLPRNFDSKSFTFQSAEEHAIKTYTNEEIHDLLNRARGKFRAFLMLMLNIGGTQADISDLLISEVNLEDATITRRRSKMRKKKSSFPVTFKLWRTTVDLLKEHINKTGTLAFTTKSGKPFVNTRMEDGAVKRSDSILTEFNALNTTNKTLKHFRKTSASRLADNPKFATIVPYFLQHAPQTMAQKHYVAPPQTLIEEACIWLGRQYDID